MDFGARALHLLKVCIYSATNSKFCLNARYPLKLPNFAIKILVVVYVCIASSGRRCHAILSVNLVSAQNSFALSLLAPELIHAPPPPHPPYAISTFERVFI